MPSLRRRFALLGLLAIAACSGSTPAPAASKAPAPTAVPSPTPTPGRPAPALVQIENGPDARPSFGLQKADLVYEYLTEGGITRFSAIYFNPSGGDKIEPIRSARLVTLRLINSYHAVLFYSGASDFVAGKIYSAGLHNYTDMNNGAPYFTRDPSRQRPHNLMTTGDQLKQGIDKAADRVTYTLPAGGEPATAGNPVRALQFNQTYAHSIAYTYSETDRAYFYRSETGPMNEGASGPPVKITNVVLLKVPHHGMGYTEDTAGAEGVDFDLQGTGAAEIYTRGQHFAGTWDLSNPTQPLRLLNQAGSDMSLPEGLSWIHLVDPEMPVTAA